MARSPRPSRPAKPAAAPSAVAAPANAGLLSADDILRLLEARHDDPFAVLGPHVEPDGRRTVRVFLPGAFEVAVIDAAGERARKRLVRMHPAGVFEGHVPFAGAYRLRVLWEDGTRSVEHDAYGYPPLLGDLDAWLLGEGTHLRPYETLGAMPCVHGETAGTRFAVWAPNASRVSVVGDWNRWDGRRHPMRRRHDAGVWEIFVPGVTDGARYKFEIAAADGRLLPLKADPYGRRAELRPGTASVVSILPPVAPPNDARRAANALDAPISVYEVHLGSWRRVPEEGDRWLTWDELAEALVAYAVDMGFTHLELMPVTEHPFDGSWGYQPLGLYAPTARFGDPQGFRRFVDAAHAAGIGVIADWVPAHFPADEHGLARFDGTHLYEHADRREGFHPDWNTLIYNFGRSEVRNYLVGNALYWLERFAIDGLRVDAVASMLYRDYSRAAGEWIPNAHGGRENLEASAFLRRLNEVIGVERPDAISVAEESTSYPQVSRPVYAGGLGFHYKWNMGWMHDTLVYMARDPVHRRHHHGEITFALVYAWSENFVLPLSHDEVVHGKGSLLERMPGDRWQRFANLRAYYGFMFGHPGKKLLFMGAEIAQDREWTHERSLDWHLLEDPAHAGVQRLVRDLNALYRRSPALFERDFGPEGFEWIDANDAERSILSFVRHDAAGERPMLVVCNFTPVVHRGLRFGVPRAGRWVERLNTDGAGYGGGDVGTPFGAASSEATASNGRLQSIVIDVPPLATVFFEWQP